MPACGGDGVGSAGSEPPALLSRDAPGEAGDRDGSQQRHRGADGISPGTHGSPPPAHGADGGQAAESKWQAKHAGSAKHIYNAEPPRRADCRYSPWPGHVGMPDTLQVHPSISPARACANTHPPPPQIVFPGLAAWHFFLCSLQL